MPFDGFPRNVRATPVPDPLFNSLLEEIEDLAELKVTLRMLWLLSQQRGQLRFVSERELVNDPTLARGMAGMGGDPSERIRQGLNLAVTRGTLLRHIVNDPSEARCYLLNTEENHRRLSQVNAEITLKGRDDSTLPDGQPFASQRQPGATPSIYDLYENNIGTFGPMMAEQLAEAEERYPAQWIEEAFKLAIYENKRSWSYIVAILRRWAAEGRPGYQETAQETENIQPGVGVKAGATLWEADGRQHGEPGRHSQEDGRQKHLEDYKRRWTRNSSQ